MKRRLFNLAALFSLLSFVTTCAFWLRALDGSNDYVEWESRNFTQVPTTRNYEQWDRSVWSVHARANPDAFFIFGRQPFYGYPRNYFNVHLYYWFVMPATALLPAVFVYKRLRKPRVVRAGLCPTCGYDLRATPSRCPECGAVPGVELQR